MGSVGVGALLGVPLVRFTLHPLYVTKFLENMTVAWQKLGVRDYIDFKLQAALKDEEIEFLIAYLQSLTQDVSQWI